MNRYLRRVQWIIGCSSFLPALLYAGQLFESGTYDQYQPDVNNGKYVFTAAGCASCHAAEGDNNLLSGGKQFETKFGLVYAPNISSHTTQGIGSWNNDTFLNAVLRGVSPSGENYIGSIFPFASYARMKVEDALDVKAFLLSLPASDSKSRPRETNWVTSMLLENWNYELPPLQTISNTQIARGQYLAEALGHCAECHSPRVTGNLGLSSELDLTKQYAGGTGITGAYAPSITAQRLKSKGPEAFIVGSLSQAKKLNGKPMNNGLMRRISQQLSQMSIEDRSAIYAYLINEPVNSSTLGETLKASNTIENQNQIQTTSNTSVPPKSSYRDNTGADNLLSRIDQHCAADDELVSIDTASVKPVVNENLNVLQQRADELTDKYCRRCHGPGGTNQATFPTFDITDIADDTGAVTKGDPASSPFYRSLINGSMPKGEKMSTGEIAEISNWIKALGEAPKTDQSVTLNKAKESSEEIVLPEFIGGSFHDRLLAISQDLNQINSLDRPYTRYLSFAYVPLPTVNCDDPIERRNPVRFFHASLNKMLNSVSRNPRLTPVQPITGTDGAIVRIDIRDYHWSQEDWESLTRARYQPAIAEQVGFDEHVWNSLATKYSYALDPSSDPLLEALAGATHTQVPILRAEWFARFASESPYYDMLLKLPPHIQQLEHQLHVDVSKDILQQRIVRAGFLNSGVSDSNRMIERFDLANRGYYWKSYDFANNDGVQSLVLHPDGPNDLNRTASHTEPFEHDGGEMIFTLPNGLQGYYLSTAAGERLLVAPTAIVSFRKKEIGKGVEIFNARSCFDCHSDGIIPKQDKIRGEILASSRFNKNQRDILLRLYPEQSVIDQHYANDRQLFISALSRLDATEVNNVGIESSLSAPDSAGGGEIITYLADYYFDSLPMAAVAREFDLSENELLDAIKIIGDSHLLRTMVDWSSRLQSGRRIQRSELEEVFTALLPRLSHRLVLQHNLDDGQQQYADIDFSDYISNALINVAEQDTHVIENPPAYIPEIKPDNPLLLSLTVPTNHVKVDDLLVFDVSSNRRCELQILYVDGEKTVTELPEILLGPKFLEAGEVRTIPYIDSGKRIRFNTPGKGETMVAYCREGGLGNNRLTAQKAIDFAKQNYQPIVRGITIEAAKQTKSDHGGSDFNTVTFNVSK